MKSVTATILAFSIGGLFQPSLQAQGFGGLFGGGKKDAAPTDTANKVDADALLARGSIIIASLGIATDLSYAAQMQMLDAFPPEKVAAITAKAEKYNELKKKRPKDAAPDATELQAKTEFDAAFSGLDTDWKSYQKDKAKAVGPAYTKVGFALAVDGLAATQVPGFVKESKDTVSSMSSNPFQLKKIRALTAMAATIGTAAQTLPKQIDNLQKVRGIAKNIAEAENISLVEPPPVASLDPKDPKGTGQPLPD
jgi:hypothetical protein